VEEVVVEEGEGAGAAFPLAPTAAVDDTGPPVTDDDKDDGADAGDDADDGAAEDVEAEATLEDGDGATVALCLGLGPLRLFSLLSCAVTDPGTSFSLSFSIAQWALAVRKKLMSFISQ